MKGAKLPLVLFLFALAPNFLVAADEIILTGVFKGKPLFIQNPYHPGQESFCIEEIYVNREKLDVNYGLSAIQINFSGLDLYSPVNIKIVHKAICKPVVVNPDAILFHSSFKFLEIHLTDSALTWTTKGDRDGAFFEIQKLYANGWSVVETVKAKGIFEGADYILYPALDEGSNKFRIKYQVKSNRYLYSDELEIEYYPEPIRLLSTTVTRVVTLSRSSPYEIMDGDGNLKLSGEGKVIDVSRLKRGEYFIYVEEMPLKFTKNF